jgi:hypothetical protein
MVKPGGDEDRNAAGFAKTKAVTCADGMMRKTSGSHSGMGNLADLGPQVPVGLPDKVWRLRHKH